MDTVDVLHSDFLTVKQPVTFVTMSGTASILPHLCPPLLSFSNLSISIQRVQSFLLRDGIDLENSGKDLRKGHCSATWMCESVCVTGAYMYKPACLHVHACMCVCVPICACTLWICACMCMCTEGVYSEQGGPRKWKTGIKKSSTQPSHSSILGIQNPQ